MKRVLCLGLLPITMLWACGGTLPDSSDGRGWALVNRSKLQSEVGDELKARNPYPEDLGESFEQKREANERTTRQINQLQRNGVARCMGLPQRDPRSHVAPAVDPAMLSRLEAAGRDVDIQNCLEELKTDPLIVDLESKAASFEDLTRRRHEHDVLTQKMADEAISDAIAAYADQHGFDLVISNESSIVYNRSQQVVDITTGVVTQLRASPAE